MPHSGQLRINLFGHLRLTFENQPIASLRTDRYQSLLAYFVLQARSPQPRSQLAGLFWPDIPDAKAKASLRQELYRLKKMLPQADQFLQVTAKTVQWLPQLPFWLDVTEFEAKLAQAAQEQEPSAKLGALQQAVALYQDGLLLTCYDAWIEPTRDRLHKRMISALVDLGHLLGDLGDHHGAIGYTQQLLQLDPLNESGYLLLMQLHAQQGERARSLQVYHQCMTLLYEEMGIAPSTETRQFYEQLLLDGASSPQIIFREPTLNPPSPDKRLLSSKTVSKMSQIDWGEAPDVGFFYGRTEESAQLRQWLGQDRCRLVSVLGMGGIGKTILAAKVANELQAEFDVIVWRSLCHAPTLDMLLKDLIGFISSQQEKTCSLPRFVHWLRQSRCLVILGNVETLFQAGKSAGRYRAGYENYGELLSVVGQASHQSCLLLTSREQSSEIATFAGTNPAVQALHLDGSPEAALAIIDANQLVGTQSEKVLLGDHYGHNPLFVQMISRSIRDVFAGEIALFLKEGTLLLADVKCLFDHQFERLTLLEKTVMTWLAINHNGMSLAELKATLYQAVCQAKLIEAIESLSWRSLIERQGDTYTQKPIFIDYVTDYVIKQMSNVLIDSTGCNRHFLQSLLARNAQ